MAIIEEPGQRGRLFCCTECGEHGGHRAMCSRHPAKPPSPSGPPPFPTLGQFMQTVENRLVNARTQIGMSMRDPHYPDDRQRYLLEIAYERTAEALTFLRQAQRESWLEGNGA